MRGTPERANLILTVDREGVVRVVNCEVEVLQVTPGELGQLLTDLVKTICSVDDNDEDQIHEVHLN